MDDLRFYVLFHSISVIPGQWAADNERLCAMESHLRNIGFSLVAVFSQIGSSIAPQIVHLDTSIPGLLYFLCGGLCLLAGTAFCWIPETNNENLSDKLSETRTVEHFIDNVTIVTNGVGLGHDDKKPENENRGNNFNGNVNNVSVINALTASQYEQKLENTDM